MIYSRMKETVGFTFDLIFEEIYHMVLRDLNLIDLAILGYTHHIFCKNSVTLKLFSNCFVSCITFYYIERKPITLYIVKLYFYWI